MKVLVTGHEGYIGCVLVPLLQEHGHEVVGLDNGMFRGCEFHPPALDCETIEVDARDAKASQIAGFDAVIHLAGEGIAEKRWSDEQKAKILDSRVAGTTLLADRIAAATNPPSVFLSGSAIGFYGELLKTHGAS